MPLGSPRPCEHNSKKRTSVVNGATGAFKTVVVLGDETLIHIIATRARKAGEDARE